MLLPHHMVDREMLAKYSKQRTGELQRALEHISCYSLSTRVSVFKTAVRLNARQKFLIASMSVIHSVI